VADLGLQPDVSRGVADGRAPPICMPNFFGERDD